MIKVMLGILTLDTLYTLFSSQTKNILGMSK